MSGPVRSLDLAELRAFCAAIDLGSLGRASRLLRVSQPALSKRMRTIEAVVGTRLVDRSPRGITPTPAGTKLYVEARKLLAQAEAVDDLVRGLSGEEAPVRLAASHTIAEFVLPGPLVDFERQRDRHLSVEPPHPPPPRGAAWGRARGPRRRRDATANPGWAHGARRKAECC